MCILLLSNSLQNLQSVKYQEGVFVKIIQKRCFESLRSTRGQTAEARRTTILQPVEHKPHSQKDRQDEKAEGYIPDEGTR